jgi:hypothetical protein
MSVLIVPSGFNPLGLTLPVLITALVTNCKEVSEGSNYPPFIT